MAGVKDKVSLRWKVTLGVIAELTCMTIIGGDGDVGRGTTPEEFPRCKGKKMESQGWVREADIQGSHEERVKRIWHWQIEWLRELWGMSNWVSIKAYFPSYGPEFSEEGLN